MTKSHLAYYTQPNPNFGKQWSLTDIPIPSQDEYRVIADKLLTSHVPSISVPTYREWVNTQCLRLLQSKIRDSESEFQSQKLEYINEADLAHQLTKLDPTQVSFMDVDIQTKFIKIHKDLR